MTQFKEFITTLPEWDGKDRIAELTRRIKINLSLYDMNDETVQRSTVMVNLLKALFHRIDTVIVGKQGIGKSTFIRWIYPFIDGERLPQDREDVTLYIIANKVLILECNEFIPLKVSGKVLICEIIDIDYSYIDIDIKQLYAQVFAEAKE